MENGTNETSIQDREDLIQNILDTVNVPTGAILEFMSAELNAGNTDTPNTTPYLLTTSSFIVYIPRCGSDWI